MGTGQMRTIGYWKSEYEKDFPFPEENSWKADETVKVKFLNELRQVLNQSHKVTYRGASRCRICGIINGNCEYEVGGRFIIPEGYIHYIEVHNVLPDEELYFYIMEKPLFGEVVNRRELSERIKEFKKNGLSILYREEQLNGEVTRFSSSYSPVKDKDILERDENIYAMQSWENNEQYKSRIDKFNQQFDLISEDKRNEYKKRYLQNMQLCALRRYGILSNAKFKSKKDMKNVGWNLIYKNSIENIGKVPGFFKNLSMANSKTVSDEYLFVLENDCLKLYFGKEEQDISQFAFRSTKDFTICDAKELLIDKGWM